MERIEIFYKLCWKKPTIFINVENGYFTLFYCFTSIIFICVTFYRIEKKKNTIYIYIWNYVHTVVLINNNRVASITTVTIVPMRASPIPKIETITDITIIDEKTQQQFEKIAIRRLIRKLDKRILIFMCLLEAASYINRVSIGKYLSFQSSTVLAKIIEPLYFWFFFDETE